MVGNQVVEVGGEHNLNRSGIVREAFEDEKGNTHCRVEQSDGTDFWCPAKFLAEQTAVVGALQDILRQMKA